MSLAKAKRPRLMAPPSVTGEISTLASLPTEILNLVCEALVYDEQDRRIINRVQWMFALRLTCQIIKEKIDDFFAKLAFRRIIVPDTSLDLARLMTLSRSRFANYVVWIMLVRYDETSTYTDSYIRSLRAEHILWIPLAERLAKLSTGAASRALPGLNEQNDGAMVPIGADGISHGIALTSALRRMRNVSSVYVECSERGGHESTAECFHSRALLFPMAVQSMALANLKPRHLTFSSGLGRRSGLQAQTLAASGHVLDCLTDLTELDILLTADAEEWKDSAAVSQSYKLVNSSRSLRSGAVNEPIDRGTHYDDHIIARILTTQPDPVQAYSQIGPFFSSCCTLRVLRLGAANLIWFENEEINPTTQLFSGFARAFHNSTHSLKHLDLSNFRVEGTELASFLQAHANLQHLCLRDLDIIGGTSFDSILELVQGTHSKLESFQCLNISQNGAAICFPSLGAIILLVYEHDYMSYTGDDLVKVCKPNDRFATAEAWEGVQNKIGLLRDDLRVRADHDLE